MGLGFWATVSVKENWRRREARFLRGFLVFQREGMYKTEILLGCHLERKGRCVKGHVRKTKREKGRSWGPSYPWKKVVLGVLIVVLPTLVFRIEDDANFHPTSFNG